MRYFAKYLPVEGEIGVGDCFEIEKGSVGRVISFSESGTTFTVIGITGYFKDKQSGTNHVVSLRNKMQLFLCSRDIKVGDKYHFNVSYSSGERVADQSDIDQLHLETNPFKTIGPISPNATWIKEGDDILSKNVHRGTYKMGNKEWMVIDAEDDAKEWDEAPDIDIAGWAKCYLIEGPCGHYH